MDSAEEDGDCTPQDSSQLWFTIADALAVGDEVSFTFDQVNAPSSEDETASFEVAFYATRSTSSTKGDSLTTGLEITADADTITSVSATQGGTTTSTVVYATTGLSVSFTPANAVPVGGFI